MVALDRLPSRGHNAQRMDTSDSIRRSFDEAAATLQAFLKSEGGLDGVQRFARAAAHTLEQGRKLLSCGNGGSMCDAMHFAEEWTGRFRGDRAALPAIAFSDPSQLTCIANDFGYDQVFARYVEALGEEGDVLVAISTSGDSPNVLRAVETARERGLTTVGLLGKGGGELRTRVDIPIVVPLATSSDRIQEVHIKILHIVIEAVERQLFPGNY
jgi:D-sedoheptulose 7-phosphate isomerase